MMTKQDFLELQAEFLSSGMGKKAFLKSKGMAFSTYTYWRRKYDETQQSQPLAPISLKTNASMDECSASLRDSKVSGVVLAFPNGLRAHFGSGSEGLLMEVIKQSLGHVLPE